jgi:hypothetical protein
MRRLTAHQGLVNILLTTCKRLVNVSVQALFNSASRVARNNA